MSRRKYLVICLRPFINNSEKIPQIISGKNRPTWMGGLMVPRTGLEAAVNKCLFLVRINVGHPNHSQSLGDSPTQNHLRNTLRTIINLYFTSKFQFQPPVNTIRLCYKSQSVNFLYAYNRSLFWDPYWRYKCTAWEESRIFEMLNLLVHIAASRVWRFIQHSDILDSIWAESRIFVMLNLLVPITASRFWRFIQRCDILDSIQN